MTLPTATDAPRVQTRTDRIAAATRTAAVAARVDHRDPASGFRTTVSRLRPAEERP